jgi:carboxyl-terminal processing protease
MTGSNQDDKAMTKKKTAFLVLSAALMATLLVSALFGQATDRSSVYRDLSIFSEVFELVRSNYVDQVSSDRLIDGAFSGVTDAIDEFSYYVPPTRMEAYKKFKDDEDNGVGLVVSKRFGFAYVIAPIDGSPADEAGVEAGDFIEKIDGKPTQSMAAWEIRAAINQGRPVKLLVLRGGETKREEITVKPAEFHPVSVTSDTIDGVAYVKVPFFETGSAAEFTAALQKAHQANARKLIVDLRGNAGGSVEEAIKAADALLTSGLITATNGRKVEPKRWQADRETAFDGEVIVLTDLSTAGGAEVFTSAVRGNKRGRSVGITTYGKAIVQRFVQLPSGGGVHLTVAHYTSPDMKAITDTGVRPDVIVDLSANSLAEDGEEKEDLILNEALELFGAQPRAKSVEKKAA